MLYQNFSHLSNLLNEYLAIHYDSLESLVEVSPVRLQTGTEIPNKILLTLLNIEKESGVGRIPVTQKPLSGSGIKTSESWYFNLYFMVSAVFDEKRYEESLQKLSTTIGFFQKNKVFTGNSNHKYTIEPITLSMHELNNIWGMMGGHHYPAFFSKMRMVTLDSDELTGMIPRISSVQQEIARK